MINIARTLLLGLVLALAGCATAPGSGSSGDGGGAPAVAPVAVPAASAKHVVLTMTGPGNVTGSKDWAEFKREWRETFADHAKAAGVSYVFAESAAGQAGRDGTLLSVNVADYRIVGIGATIWFGMMTGTASIDATVRYSDLRNGAVFGEQPYKTTSSAWSGVFAKVTPQQVDSIATEVFKSITGKR
ncbi:MAG: hypothetical protein R3E48_16400 [Burkholderiaceae bacterium]